MLLYIFHTSRLQLCGAATFHCRSLQLIESNRVSRSHPDCHSIMQQFAQAYMCSTGKKIEKSLKAINRRAQQWQLAYCCLGSGGWRFRLWVWHLALRTTKRTCGCKKSENYVKREKQNLESCNKGNIGNGK